MSSLKKALIAQMKPLMDARGFKFKSSQDFFFRRQGDVTDVFQLVCLDGKPGLRVQPNVGVRVEQIEVLFNHTSCFEGSTKQGTVSIGNSIGEYMNGDSRSCEFIFESEAQIALISKAIEKAFDEFALPYFERLGSLAAVDAELNTFPTERTSHRALPWLRCSTGIIAAKLTGRNDYSQLKSYYTSVVSQNSDGFYLKYFLPLLDELELLPSNAKNAQS